MKISVYSLDKLGKVVSDLKVSFLDNTNLNVLSFGLNGDLGAGKTTFLKELFKNLGVGNSVFSPTFVLRRDYEIQDYKIIHIDAYRLEKKADIKNIISEKEISEISSFKKVLIFVEWASLADWKYNFVLNFSYVDEDIRKLEVVKV